MTQYLFLLFGTICLLAVVVFLAAKWLVRQAHRNQYLSFARANKLNLNYDKKNAYSLQGQIGDYPLEVIPFHTGSLEKNWIKASTPMVNPNGKYLLLEKGMAKLSWHEEIEQEGSIHIEHDFDPRIKIRSSDLLFSSRLLTQNVKDRIQEAFTHLNQGALFIKGDELALLTPEVLTKLEGWEDFKKLVSLMVELKKELNS